MAEAGLTDVWLQLLVSEWTFKQDPPLPSVTERFAPFIRLAVWDVLNSPKDSPLVHTIYSTLAEAKKAARNRAAGDVEALFG